MDLASPNPTLKPVKFLCSYGGRILPRYPDGKLRYHGGQTRLLSVDSSISFAELMVKMGDICGSSVSVSLRCQLPAEDLDSLVSITSDEDLAHLIEEYDHAVSAAAPSFKIRAFLSGYRTLRRASPRSSPLKPSCGTPRFPVSPARRLRNCSSRPPAHPIVSQKYAGNTPKQFAYHYYNEQGNSCGLSHLIHNRNVSQ